MKLNGSRTIHEEVSVSVTEAWKVLKMEILNKAGIRPYWYLLDKKPGYFFEDEDSRHGSSGDVEVRKATDEELVIYHAVRALEKAAQLHEYSQHYA